MRKTVLIAIALLFVIISTGAATAIGQENVKVRFKRHVDRDAAKLRTAYDNAIKQARAKGDINSISQLERARQAFVEKGLVYLPSVKPPSQLSRAISLYFTNLQLARKRFVAAYGRSIARKQRRGDLTQAAALMRERNAWSRYLYRGDFSSHPPSYVEKINSTPDLTQSDPKGGFSNGGSAFCGPVAVSNGLMWLATNGYGRLAPNIQNKKEDQFILTRTLASKEFMNTDVISGTGASGIMNGLMKYLKKQGYEYNRLEFQGWRKHPSKFRTNVSTPQLPWIKNALIGNSSVWLNLGWYTYDSSTDKYNRFSGHWVTLVGYGVDSTGKKDANILIIHDPSGRAGKKFANEFIVPEQIESGELIGEKSGLPRSAVGYYKLTGGIHLKKGADAGILDAVIVLQMRD